MELKDTIDSMNSESYKDRFIAEYSQLNIRINGLSLMLNKYLDGTLSFIPSCSYSLLKAQLKAMIRYSELLGQRAKIEGIELPSYFNIEPVLEPAVNLVVKPALESVSKKEEITSTESKKQSKEDKKSIKSESIKTGLEEVNV